MLEKGSTAKLSEGREFLVDEPNLFHHPHFIQLACLITFLVDRSNTFVYVYNLKLGGFEGYKKNNHRKGVKFWR
jgi:hypothetical protein